MNWSGHSEKRVAAYIRAVQEAVGADDGAKKAEWEATLRAHIASVVAELGAEGSDGKVTDERMEEVFAELAAPESYREGGGAGGDGGAGAGEGGSRGGRRSGWGAAWRAARDGALVLLGMALATAWWHWKGGAEGGRGGGGAGDGERAAAARPLPDGGGEEEAAGGERAPEPERLALVDVVQENLDFDNRATLQFVFSHSPDNGQMTRRLVLKDGATGRMLEYSLSRPSLWERWDARRTVKVTTGPLSGDGLEYELAAGLPSAEDGVLPLEEDAKGTFTTTRDLGAVQAGIWRYANPFERRTVDLIFPVRVDPEELETHLTIEPDVGLTDIRGSTLEGDFKEKQTYKIKIRKGLKAVCGVELDRDVELDVEMPHLARTMWLADRARVLLLSPKGSMKVDMDLYGLAGLEARLRPVREGALAEWVAHEGEEEWNSGRNEQWTADLTRQGRTTTNWLDAAVVEAEMDEDAAWAVHRMRIDLRDLLEEGAAARGLYILETTGFEAKKTDGGGLERGNRHRREAAVLAITDIGLHAQWKGTSQEMLVLANSIRTGRPMEGVGLTLWGRGREPLAKGTTGADGLARLAWTVADEEEHGSAMLVTARAGEDFGALEVDSIGVDCAGEAPESWHLGDGEHEAYVWTDRGIYRHGETVRFQALVRDRAGRAPEPYPVEAAVVRERDRTVVSKTGAMPDETGAVACEIAMPEEWASGKYRLELRAASGEFLGAAGVSLEDFAPAQVRVDVAAAAGRAPGEVAADVRAAYLFGREAANLPYRATWRLRAVPFRPEGWAGWTFGDATREFQMRSGRQEEGRLGEDGTARVFLAIDGSLRPPARLAASCSVSVREEGGRPARGWTEMAVDVYPRYVGLRGGWGDGDAAAGETQRVEIVQLRPDGTRADDAPPLHLALYRVTWASALRKNSNGDWQWVDNQRKTLLEEATVAGGGETRTWDFTPEATGEYLLVARDPASGAAASLRFDASSGGEAKAPRRGGAGLKLEWAGKPAAPGGTAKLKATSPFAGYAVLTVFDRELRWARGLDLAEGTTTLEVPVPADTDLASMTARLAVVRPVVGERMWSEHRLVADIPLPVARPERALKVSLRAPKKTKPQETLKVRVAVKDASGAPAAGAECSVAAVDEGICMLTAFESPDPEAWLRRARWGELLWGDDYGKLMRESEADEAGESAPGGDAATRFLKNRLNPVKARRYKPTALWSGIVKTDAKGVAEISFDIPQFTGELRLMAVAWDAARSGAADRAATVRRDLVVQPSFPRVLGCGDEARVAVPLHNTGTRPSHAVARLTVAGHAAVEGAGTAEADLAPGATKTLWFTVRGAASPGTATFHLDVDDGRDLHREDVELAVRPENGGVQTRFATLSLKPGESAVVAPPEGWLAESVAAEIAASALPSLDAAPALEHVATYPHGCLEQTISGVLPFVANPDWAKRLRPGSRAVADPAAAVREAMARVVRMQRRDGGFGMWPGAGETDVAGTFYAVQFLLEARRAGFEPDGDALHAAMGWLDNRWRRGAEEERARRWERANICWLKAMAGDVPDGWLNELGEDADAADAPSRTLLAAAMLLAGEPARGLALMENVDPAGDFTGGEWCGVLETPVRYVSILLSAWLDVDAESPKAAALLGVLGRLRGGAEHWGTTQANAMALCAIGKAAAHLPAEERPFDLTLEAAGKRERAGGRDAVRAWGPGEGGAAGIAVSNAGPGTATLVVRHEGIPAEPEEPMARGVSVSCEYRDVQGRPLDVSELRQGELFAMDLAVVPDTPRSDLVIEAILPAGWEIENPNLLTSEAASWAPPEEWCGSERHREMRDDRLLVFTGRVDREAHYACLVRAVTPGTYARPAVTVEGMYRPDVRAVGVRGTVRVAE